jgi:hypothetical protein
VLTLSKPLTFVLEVLLLLSYSSRGDQIRGVVVPLGFTVNHFPGKTEQKSTAQQVRNYHQVLLGYLAMLTSHDVQARLR